MTHFQKIHHLQKFLNQPHHSYYDDFTADILLYFNDDFSEVNPQFAFLHELNSPEAIEQKIEFCYPNLSSNSMPSKNQKMILSTTTLGANFFPFPP